MPTIVVSIGWEQTSYTVSEENGEVRACAILNGTIEKTVQVFFTTSISGQASGKKKTLVLVIECVYLKLFHFFAANMDFIELAQDLIFSIDTTTLCVNISIVDDQILESEESFELKLDAAETSRVLLNSATVTITDTDSQSLISNGNFVFFLFFVIHFLLHTM